MSSILIQVQGPSALEINNGHFKTGGAILDDFRRLLNNPVPRLGFITKGVQDPGNHLSELLEQTLRFRILISMRAGGLHAGIGPSFEVSITSANDVVNFLEILAKSSRIKPYLTNIPKPPIIVRERTLLVEDIARSIQDTTNVTDQARLLASVFLVLPDIPSNQPSWIEAFERITVAPQEGDIAYLLNILNQAYPATLIRTTAAGEGLPVNMRHNNPNALPIAPQYLRREFTQIRDQWFADVGNANGRLNQGTLHLPPSDFVLELCASGLEGVGIINNERHLTAHDSWAFIVSSLSVNGTTGPYWFLVRKTQDIGQLRAQIVRAMGVGTAYLNNRREEVLTAFDSLINNTPLSRTIPFVSDLLIEHERSEEKRNNLNEQIERSKGTVRELPVAAEEIIYQVYEGNISVGAAIIELLNKNIIEAERARPYWFRSLAETAYEEEDLPGLLAILDLRELAVAHTAAKKAFRLIDFLSYGPSIDEM